MTNLLLQGGASAGEPLCPTPYRLRLLVNSHPPSCLTARPMMPSSMLSRRTRGAIQLRVHKGRLVAREVAAGGNPGAGPELLDSGDGRVGVDDDERSCGQDDVAEVDVLGVGADTQARSATARIWTASSPPPRAIPSVALMMRRRRWRLWEPRACNPQPAPRCRRHT